MILEKMGDFFDRRLGEYEAHQLGEIDSAREFYPYTAQLLPRGAGARVLDLGCGTGLELDFYFSLNMTAHVTGVDLAHDMLARLHDKHGDKSLELIEGSYFDVPFGENIFDAAVSVESLHHFTQTEKLPLYRKVCLALHDGGYFVLTDYFCDTDEQESYFRRELLRLKSEQGLADGEFYHYDTPLTVPHEIEALTLAGFSSVKLDASWGSTHTIIAYK